MGEPLVRLIVWIVVILALVAFLFQFVGPFLLNLAH